MIPLFLHSLSFYDFVKGLSAALEEHVNGLKTKPLLTQTRLTKHSEPQPRAIMAQTLGLQRVCLSGTFRLLELEITTRIQLTDVCTHRPPLKHQLADNFAGYGRVVNSPLIVSSR